jgi:hypothetical protein
MPTTAIALLTGVESPASTVHDTRAPRTTGTTYHINRSKPVSLGADGARHATEYLAHYYGREQAHVPLADTPTTSGQLLEELDRLHGVGVTDVLLFPCTADRRQLDLITDSVHDRLQSGGSAVVRS